MFVSTHGITARPTSVPPFIGILDVYPNAATAYSFRKLRSAYSGSCIRVRRSSDNTEQDIGFVSNVLDTASLLSFVGSNNGFVTTWYDQSGNNLNSTQSIAVNQPQIVSSGVIVKTSGNITCMSCLNKDLSNTQTNTATQATFIASECLSTGGGSSFMVPFGTIGSNSSSTYAGSVANGSGSTASSNFGTPSFFVNDLPIGSTRGNLFNAYAINNETILNIINGGSTTSNRFLQYTTSGFSGNYKVFEVIIYNTNQSSNRTGINTNINNFYSIYP
jgi:hypothetical protein